MKNAGSAIAVVVVMMAAGCATPRTSFYLVPDPEGHVGEVTVTNRATSVTLNQANETVGAPRDDKPFSTSRVAEPDEIQTKFGDALALVPDRPKGFLIYFESGSAKIDPSSKSVQDQVVEEVRKRDSRDVSVNGHTDRTGDDALNMKLSLERANAVKNWLIEQGIRPEFLGIEYYGESKPIVPTADNVSEPKNRRVEVVVR